MSVEIRTSIIRGFRITREEYDKAYEYFTEEYPTYADCEDYLIGDSYTDDGDVFIGYELYTIEPGESIRTTDIDGQGSFYCHNGDDELCTLLAQKINKNYTEIANYLVVRWF